MKTYCCSELNDNTGWKVGSKKQDAQLYTVLKEVEDCDCKTRCSTCGVCIHMYSCTCMDATIHITVCKHIHYVQIAVLGCKSLNTQQSAPMHKEEVDYFSHVLSSSSHQPLLQTKAKLQYSLRDLKEMVEKCEEEEVLKSTLLHVRRAVFQLATAEKLPKTLPKNIHMHQTLTMKNNVNLSLLK